MKNKRRFKNLLTCVFLAVILLILIAPEIVEARGFGGGFGRSFGGRSFGGRGFGRSFGGSRSRSFGTPRPRSSFGGSRMNTGRVTPSQRAASSFGGKRLSSPRAYTQRYGTPRKSMTQSFTKNGVSQNYVMHSYGGYGNGLMMGYMMGTTSWLWMMPFHPAFYYSRPYYVDNPDGTIGVYPPTFSWSKVFFTLLIAGVIIYIIAVIIRNRGGGVQSQSSFS